jgi:hypothetical protein
MCVAPEWGRNREDILATPRHALDILLSRAMLHLPFPAAHFATAHSKTYLMT